MNIMLIAVSLVFLLCMIRGCRRGFVAALVSSVSLILSMALVSVATPYVTEFLEKNTGLYQMVEKKCAEVFVLEANEENGTDTQEAENADQENADRENTDQENRNQEGTDRELFWGSNGEADARRIQSLKLPEIIENLLISNRTAENYKKLAVDTLQGYVTAYMTRLIVNILTFLITWILVMAAVWVAGRLLNQIAELPGIRVLNRILGVMLGAVQGLIWVWMAFLLITIAANTEAGEAMLEMISENAFLRMLYNQNIILNVIQNIMNW